MPRSSAPQKTQRPSKPSTPLDWLARIVVHIPNKYEQLVRYVGYYSTKSRGMRKKSEADDAIPSITPGELTSKQFRRSRAMLIQKIYEVDPLCCPNCQNQMRIVSILEAGPPVKKILEHLDLWDTRNHDPPNEDLSHILRTRLRRFGLPNPAIRLLGLSPSLSEKKIETGIGAGLRLETGRLPCFSRFFRLPQTMFNSSAIFAHSSSDSTTARPPALRRNMLRRRAGAGGRETIEKSGVVSLTKSEFLSFLTDPLAWSHQVHKHRTPHPSPLETSTFCCSSHLARLFGSMCIINRFSLFCFAE